MMMNLETFTDLLPKKPYCSDDLQAGLKIFSSKIAVSKKYLQLNHPDYIRFFIFDVDRQSARIDWQDKNVVAPTWICVNPQNGHAHLVYELEKPVYLADLSKYKRLKYAVAVEEGLRSILESDRGYSGLISKNPFHKDWLTIQTGKKYSLDELAVVNLHLYSKKHRKPGDISGLGRNCSLFEELRHWAYREIYKNSSNWNQAVLNQAREINQLFNPPLPESEIRGVSKSVASWTSLYFGRNDGGKTQWHKSQQKKSVKVKIKKTKELREKAKELREQGRSFWQIGCELNIPESTVRNWLK
jgi:hypothetical protein